MFQTIRVATDARGVATVTLERPDKRNALSAAMMDDLTRAAAALGADPAVRVVVLTGAGDSFCAGGDLDWMRAQIAASSARRAAEARRLAGMLQALNDLPKPLIGRVQGQAYGGGIGLMAVCDLAIGADHARFGLTEVRLGLIPATIGPYVIARMGAAMARRIFFSPRLFGADEALRLGLLARAVPAGDLDLALAEEIAPFLDAAPGAVAEAKALLRRIAAPVTEEMVEASIAALVARWESAEAAEGIAAFFDRRQPEWGPAG